jgi:uncharacterized protein YcbK (DUF882 family)
MLITPNFSTDEVQCHCGCGENEMDEEFMRMLQQLREEAGFPFRISSGKRCLKHNSNVSTAKNKAGIHTFGKAVDILVGSVNTTKTLKLIKQAQTVGFTGLGLALKGDRSKRFIHLDNRGVDFSLPAVWTY